MLESKGSMSLHRVVGAEDARICGPMGSLGCLFINFGANMDIVPFCRCGL